MNKKQKVVSVDFKILDKVQCPDCGGSGIGFSRALKVDDIAEATVNCQCNLCLGTGNVTPDTWIVFVSHNVKEFLKWSTVIFIITFVAIVLAVIVPQPVSAVFVLVSVVSFCLLVWVALWTKFLWSRFKTFEKILDLEKERNDSNVEKADLFFDKDIEVEKPDQIDLAQDNNYQFLLK